MRAMPEVNGATVELHDSTCPAVARPTRERVVTDPMPLRAIRVPDAEWQAAQAAAKVLGTTVSAAVREALAALVVRATEAEA